MAECRRRYDSWKIYGLSGFFLFFLVICLTSSLTPFGVATSPDSVSYLDIASHIRNGDGWKTTDFSLAAVGHSGVVQNRAWPPLYPFVLSAFVSDSYDVIGAAGLSRALSVLTALLVFFLVARRGHWLVALCVASIAVLSVPFLTIFTFAWSEAIFVPLLLLALLCSAEYLEARDEGKKKRALWFIGFVLALALLPCARYIGIALVVLLPLTFVLSRRDAWDRALFCVSIPLYSVPVGFLLWGNIKASGALSGVPRQPSDQGLGANLLDMADAFLVMLPVSLSALLVAGGVTIFFAVLAKHVLAACERGDDRHAPVGMLAAFSAVVYLLALVIMRTHTSFDRIDVRLVAPSFPLLLISMFFGGRALARKTNQAVLVAILGCFIFANLATAGYAQYRSSAQAWREHADPGLPMRTGVSYRNFTQTTSWNDYRGVCSQFVAPGGVIVVRRALIWHFLSGCRTAELPPVSDLPALDMLHRMPSGSVLMLERSELGRYLEVLRPGRDYSGVTDLGGNELIRLVQSRRP